MRDQELRQAITFDCNPCDCIGRIETLEWIRLQFGSSEQISLWKG